MTRNLTALALAVLAMLSAVKTPAQAQAQERLRPGDTIRVTTETGKPLTGVLHALSDDSVTLRFGDLLHGRSRAEVVKFERKSGRAASGRTLLYAMGAAAAAGGLIGAITYEPCDEVGFMACFMDPESTGQAFVYGAAAGGVVVGVPLGVVLIPFIKYDRWERVGGRATTRRAAVGFTFSARFPIQSL